MLRGAEGQEGAAKDKPVERVVFNAVTKQAVQEAMRHPRDIDEPLVDAYLARRALDYLVGFTLSPVLWRKLPGARSAGRVQSVALRLVCDREAEIERFRPQEYWSSWPRSRRRAANEFTARLVELDGSKLDRLRLGRRRRRPTRAVAAARDSRASPSTSVEAKPQPRNPPPPFTTSTLQQEAQRKLGFDAAAPCRSRSASTRASTRRRDRRPHHLYAHRRRRHRARGADRRARA